MEKKIFEKKGFKKEKCPKSLSGKSLIKLFGNLAFISCIDYGVY